MRIKTWCSILLVLLISLSMVSALGTVHPLTACQVLDEADQWYELTAPLSATGDCISITAPDVHIQGNGFSISGTGAPGSIGIDIRQAPDVQLSNLEIESFDTGIRADSSPDIGVESVVVRHARIGIKFETLSSSSIQDAVITQSDVGIQFTAVRNSSLIDSVITESTKGIRVVTSSDLVLDQLTLEDAPTGVEFSHTSNSQLSRVLIRQTQIGLSIKNSFANSFTQLDIDAETQGILCTSSSQNQFLQSVINAPRPLTLRQSSSGVVLLNSSLDRSNIRVEAGSKLIEARYLTIRLQDDLTGEPLEGVALTLRTSSGAPAATGVTALDGTFTTDQFTVAMNNGRREISPEPFRVSAQKEGYYAATRIVDLTEEGNVQLALIPQGALGSELLTQIQLSPPLPLTIGSEPQVVQLSATASTFPLSLTPRILDETGVEVWRDESRTVESLADFPFELRLPTDLAGGVYELVVDATTETESQSVLLGVITALNPESEFPIIEDITTTPELPATFTLPGASFLLDFMALDPTLEVSVEVRSGTTLLYTTPVTLITSTALPLNISLPDTLQSGTYSFLLRARDGLNNTNVRTIGTASIQSPSPAVVSEPAASSSGGGSRGSGRARSSERVNRTLLAFATNGSLQNETNESIEPISVGNPFEGEATPEESSQSRQVGGMLNVMGNSPGYTIILFIVVMVVAYVIIRLTAGEEPISPPATPVKKRSPRKKKPSNESPPTE